MMKSRLRLAALSLLMSASVGAFAAPAVSFQVTGDEGEVHTVPLHRVKEVYRNGELIWHREH